LFAGTKPSSLVLTPLVDRRALVVPAGGSIGSVRVGMVGALHERGGTRTTRRSNDDTVTTAPECDVRMRWEMAIGEIEDA
jgi:hypothetical protein